MINKGTRTGHKKHLLKIAMASHTCWCLEWYIPTQSYLCHQSLERRISSSVARFPLPATRRQLYLQSIAVEAERALVITARMPAAIAQRRTGPNATVNMFPSTSLCEGGDSNQSVC